MDFEIVENIICHKSSHFRYYPPNKSAGILREFAGISQDVNLKNFTLNIPRSGMESQENFHISPSPQA